MLKFVNKNPYKELKSDDASNSTPNEQSSEEKAIFKTYLPYNQPFFLQIADSLLSSFYPKTCPHCNITLTKRISTRPELIRCASCNYLTSRYSYTPLHNLRLPLWMLGFALHESIQQYPKVVTAKELQRKLGISYNSASLLKRRVQLFAVDQMPKMKLLIEQKLRESAPKKDLPEGDVDLTKKLKGKTIVAVDTLALFSASQRANKGRARHRHGGISASVFLSDKLGGKQIDSIIQTIAVKGEGAIFQIVRDQTMNSLGSQIREFVPLSTIIFSDEGYPFLKGIYRNHRMINHSAKSKDKRYKWARNRWSKNGISSQVAEGNQSKLKNAFKAYNYFRPKFAPFYLSEYSLLSNVKAYGLEAIANVGRADSEKVSSVNLGLADGLEGKMEKREKGVVGKVSRKFLPTYLID
jgi:hypothetical protein